MDIVVSIKRLCCLEWVMRIQPGTRRHCKVLAADRVIVIKVNRDPPFFHISYEVVHHKKVLLDTEWCTIFLDA